MILRVKFSKYSYLKYISHLDLLRVFDRTFRIINLPIEYSNGYNPRPKFSVALPLPLKVEGFGEYLEIHLTKKIDIKEFIEKMNEELPETIEIIDGEYTDAKKGITHYMEWADYELCFSILENIREDELNEKIINFLNEKEIFIEKTKEKKRRIIRWNENIIPLIENIKINKMDSDEIILKARLKVNLGNLKPEDFLNAFLLNSNLSLKDDSLEIKRIELLGEENGEIHSIFKGEDK